MSEFILCDEFESEVERPGLTGIALRSRSIPLIEYMRTALDVSKRCGMELQIEEDSDRYRFDFCLHGSIILGRQLGEWCDLIAGSDMFTMMIDPQRPQSIRASFYRSKE